MTEPCSGQDPAKLFFQHVSLVYKHLGEHAFEPFVELAHTDPERAIREFPQYLEKVLSSGNNLFRGMMCGGPAPEATAPLLNILGSFYPKLPKPVREQGLKQALNFLNGLNYSNSQDNVALIQEPWLVGDIVINMPLYWSGYDEYRKLGEVQTWEDFERNFISEKDGQAYLNARSFAWLSYALSRVEFAPQADRARRVFAEIFTDEVDRTKDFIAGLIHEHAFCDEFFPDGNIPYKNGVADRMI